MNLDRSLSISSGVYKYAILDPRKTRQAETNNASIFSQDQVFGIEVTDPLLSNKCINNIDPQHLGKNIYSSAIEESVNIELPPNGTVLATIRPDLDAVGAMAVMTMRENNIDLTPAMERIFLVARADKFTQGNYPGCTNLPTLDKPWSDSFTSVESSRELAAIAAAVADFRVSISERVNLMIDWLLNGNEPLNYREKVDNERIQMVHALANGDIKYRTAADGKIAVVESTHRSATMIGYCLAPVVIALNPEFRIGSGEPHRKYTICQYTVGYAKFAKLMEELNKIEPGWGGSPTIIGSPQGSSSILSVDFVLDKVKELLILGNKE